MIRKLAISLFVLASLFSSFCTPAFASMGKGLICAGFDEGLGKNNPKQNLEDNALYRTLLLFFESNNKYATWIIHKQGDLFDFWEFSRSFYDTDDDYIYLSTNEKFFNRYDVVGVIDRNTLEHLSVPLTKDGLRFMTLDEMKRSEKGFLYPVDCELVNSKMEFMQEIQKIVDVVTLNMNERLKDKKI